MTEEQIQTIKRIRDVGLGYQKIGIVLNIPRNKVRNYYKANDLCGYAKKRLRNTEVKQMERDCPKTVWRQCGNLLDNKPTGRRRIYYSDRCRGEWAKIRPILYKHEYMLCGKEFESQRLLYLGQVLAGRRYRRNREAAVCTEKIPMVPKWIKDLLDG